MVRAAVMDRQNLPSAVDGQVCAGEGTVFQNGCVAVDDQSTARNGGLRPRGSQRPIFGIGKVSLQSCCCCIAWLGC